MGPGSGAPGRSCPQTSSRSESHCPATDRKKITSTDKLSILGNQIKKLIILQNGPIWVVKIKTGKNLTKRKVGNVSTPNKSNPRLNFFTLVNIVQTCSLRVIFLEKQTWS